jgi:hypothetical protein
MPARKHVPVDQSNGAIDLLYFPPARRAVAPCASETRCHEPIDSAVALKQECGLGYVFVTKCKRTECDRRIYCEETQLDDVLRYTLRYPEHFIGIGAFNPLDIAESTHQTEIGVRHYGFKGIYVHPGDFGISLCDRRMYPLYVKALDWKTPVIVNLETIGNAKPVRPDTLQQIAGDLPDLNFVIVQPRWTSDEMSRLTDDAPNIHYCFDTDSLLNGNKLEFANSPTGRSRCMWGSNGYAWEEALAGLAKTKLHDRESFLHGNATRVFGLKQHRKRKVKPYHEIEEVPLRIVAE